MSGPRIAPYGAWRSPFSADMVAGESVRFGDLAVDGADVYWIEGRPQENGRCVVVRRGADGGTEDVTPASVNVRTRVHEYGGGAFTVREGIVYFVNFADQQVYRQPAGGTATLLTRSPDSRYADLTVDARRGRLICVREDHDAAGGEVRNRLVSIDLASGAETVLVQGADFFSNPRLSPDAARLAWVAWNHPQMPWDGTELWMTELGEDGGVDGASRVAGGTSESVFQPEWSPAGVLTFVSDRTGWWNLYVLDGEAPRNLCETEAEFGLPQWVFGMSTYGYAGAERIVCTVNAKGLWRLATLEAATGRLARIDSVFTQVSSMKCAPGAAFFVGGSPSAPPCVARLDLDSGRIEVVRSACADAPASDSLSAPEAIEFPTAGGATAHAFFYPPCSAEFAGPAQERPPLIVKSHGGPTGAATASLSLEIQYWTSRGFAVVDVNYRGSTGFGREYRNALRGAWGVADVEDCVNAARHLAAQGRVDGERLAIRGGSAGGYSTLCALTFHDDFKAGASYYGVSDLEALARDTHKFESRYLDLLVGPYPERRDVYRERSPIHYAERLSCPLILLQGLEDKIVPPDQSEKMFDALRGKGIPVAYLTFEGEQHGLRQSANISRSLEAELCFYGAVFGFPVMGPATPLAIENLAGQWVEVRDEQGRPCGLELRTA